LLRAAFAQLESDPHAIVRWMSSARPGDFARLAPLVVQHARQDDPTAGELMRLAAGHVDALAKRLGALGVPRLALAGGLASSLTPWLSRETRGRLVPAAADALAGALRLARAQAQSARLAS
jgi:glucosamine kinase